MTSHVTAVGRHKDLITLSLFNRVTGDYSTCYLGWGQATLLAKAITETRADIESPVPNNKRILLCE